MKKALALLSLVCWSLVAAAQSNQAFQQKIYYASDYGTWQIKSQTPNTYQFQPASLCQFPQSGGGAPFNVFNQNAPVYIQDATAANSEVLTPTYVNITESMCQVSMSTTHNHFSFTLMSGTAGLQETLNVINGNIPYAVEVVLDRNWYTALGAIPGQTAAAVIAAAKGSTAAVLVDQTAAPAAYYQWNGAHYAVVNSGSGSLPGGSGLVKVTGGTGGLAQAGFDYVVPSGSITGSAGTAGSLNAASTLPNGTTATTQATSDTSANVASDQYVQNVVAGTGAVLRSPAAGVSQTITQTSGTHLNLNNVGILGLNFGTGVGSPFNNVVYADGVIGAGIGQSQAAWAGSTFYNYCQAVSYSSANYIEVNINGDNSTTPGTNKTVWYPVPNGAVPTQFDCAFYTAAAKVAGGAGASVHVGNGTYMSAIGMVEPTVTSPQYPVVNIFGEGTGVSQIQLNQNNGDGLPFFYQPEGSTAYAFPTFQIRGVTLNANFNAPAVIGIYGAINPTLQDLLIENAADGSDHYIELGDFNNTANGWVYQPVVKNVIINRNAGGAGSGVVIPAATISGGVPTFTISNGGTNYTQGLVTAKLIGTSAFGNPCSSIGTTTATITAGAVTALTTTATGCVSPLYAVVFPTNTSYGLKLSNVSDRGEFDYILDGGVGAIAGLYTSNIVSNITISNYHPINVMRGIQNYGGVTLISPQFDTMEQYAFDNESAYSPINVISPDFEYGANTMNGARDYYFGTLAGTPGLNSPVAFNIYGETCGSTVTHAGYAHFDSSAGVIDSTVGSDSATMPTYVHAKNPMYCNQFQQAQALSSPTDVGDNFQFANGSLGSQWNLGITSGPLGSGSQTMALTEANSTSTPLLGQYQFSFSNIIAATSGQNYASPIVNHVGSYWNGTATTATSVSEQLVFGTGSNPTQTYQFTMGGTPSSGAKSYTFDNPITVPSCTGCGSGGSFASPPPIGNTTPNTGAFTTLSATAGVSAISDGVHSGYQSLAGNTANQAVAANTAGFMGPNAASFTAYACQLPSVQPNGQVLSCAAPVSGVSAGSWVSGASGSASGALAGTYPSPTLSAATQATIGPNQNAFFLSPNCNGQTNCTAANANTKLCSDATVTNASTTVTSTACGNFTAADVGKRIWAFSTCSTDGGASLAAIIGSATAATISAVGSTTSITISQNATATQNATACIIYGTPDDTAQSNLETAVASTSVNYCPGIQLPAGGMMWTAWHLNFNPSGCTRNPEVKGATAVGGGFNVGGQGRTQSVIYLDPLISMAACTTGCMYLPQNAEWHDFSFNGGNSSRSGITSAKQLLVAAGYSVLRNMGFTNFGYADNNLAGWYENVAPPIYCINSDFDGWGSVSVKLDPGWLYSTGCSYQDSQGGTETVASVWMTAASGGTDQIYSLHDLFIGSSFNSATSTLVFNNNGGSYAQFIGSNFSSQSTTATVNGYSHYSNGTAWLTGDLFRLNTFIGQNLGVQVGTSGAQVYLRDNIFQTTSSGNWVNFGAAGTNIHDMGGNPPFTGPNIQTNTGVWSAGSLVPYASVNGACTGTATSSSTLGLYGTGPNVTATTCTSTTIGAGQVMTHAGTLGYLQVTAGTGGVSSSSGVFTVFKNGSSTAVTCTMGTGTSCYDGTHQVSFANGDLVSVEFTTQASETLGNVKALVSAY